MFGKSKSKEPDPEVEARRIDAMKASVATALEHLKKHAEAGNTDRCEGAAKRIVESLKNPKLPPEFTKQARVISDSLILHGFMKATAVAAKAALDAGKSDNVEVRSAKIKLARDLLSGAMRNKAPKEFKAQCERLLEVAMLSGGVKAKGPTKAKPRDTAPKSENRAKPKTEPAAKAPPPKPAKPSGGAANSGATAHDMLKRNAGAAT